MPFSAADLGCKVIHEKSQEVHGAGTRGLREVTQPLLPDSTAPPRRLAAREAVSNSSKWEVGAVCSESHQHVVCVSSCVRAQLQQLVRCGLLTNRHGRWMTSGDDETLLISELSLEKGVISPPPLPCVKINTGGSGSRAHTNLMHIYSIRQGLRGTSSQARPQLSA